MDVLKKRLLFFALLVFPIQSFVITNVVKGLTLFNITVLILTFLSILFDRKFFYAFSIFILSFISYFSLQEIFNAYFVIDLNNVYATAISNISPEPYYETVFRRSFITQSIYLMIVVSFFIILILFSKHYSEKYILNISFIAIWIFILYGWYEFFAYLITHKNPDFISNRITMESHKASLFQTIKIGSLSIQRIKSLSGEPSMFAFTVLPFFVLGFYLKKRLFAFISGITLLVSTSTTALLGLFLFIIFDLVVLKKNVLKKIFIYLSTMIGIYLAFKDIIDPIIKLAIAKVNLEASSGQSRFLFFYNHFNAWLHSDLFHLLFGYGWGFARSTDGISTLLFNTGLIGTVLFVGFMIAPYFFVRKTVYVKALFVANLIVCITMLVSVPEFYYPHIWIISALLWYEFIKRKQNEQV